MEFRGLSWIQWTKVYQRMQVANGKGWFFSVLSLLPVQTWSWEFSLSRLMAWCWMMARRLTIGAVGMLRLTLSVHIATEPRGKRTRTLVFHECFTFILHHHWTMSTSCLGGKHATVALEVEWWGPALQMWRHCNNNSRRYKSKTHTQIWNLFI